MSKTNLITKLCGLYECDNRDYLHIKDTALYLYSVPTKKDQKRAKKIKKYAKVLKSMLGIIHTKGKRSKIKSYLVAIKIMPDMKYLRYSIRHVSKKDEVLRLRLKYSPQAKIKDNKVAKKAVDKTKIHNKLTIKPDNNKLNLIKNNHVYKTFIKIDNKKLPHGISKADLGL